MHRTYSDPALYGGSIPEYSRYRGSFETSGKLLSRIGKGKFTTSQFIPHPLYRTAQGSRLSLGFLPSQIEGTLSRGAAYKRAALLRPVQSTFDTPWVRILSCGTDDDFIVSLNFTRSLVLQRILPYFKYERTGLNFGSPYCNGPKTKGRPDQLRSVDLLALSLWYLKTKSTMYSMCPIFRIVPTSISVWLDYSFKVLLRVVKKRSCTDFEVKWPDEGDRLAFSLLLQNNRVYGPLPKGVFAVTDGGRMPCVDYTDQDLQNAYNEGYIQSVEVTNLFVWNFYGEIIHAAVNNPGSWHDTKLAGASGLYYPKLSDVITSPGYAILGDSAFVNNTSTTNGKVLRGRKSNET